MSWQKRLETGTYSWPAARSAGSSSLPLAPEGLQLLLDGIDLRGAPLRLLLSDAAPDEPGKRQGLLRRGGTAKDRGKKKRKRGGQRSRITGQDKLPVESTGVVPGLTWLMVYSLGSDLAPVSHDTERFVRLRVLLD